MSDRQKFAEQFQQELASGDSGGALAMKIASLEELAERKIREFGGTISSTGTPESRLQFYMARLGLMEKCLERWPRWPFIEKLLIARDVYAALAQYRSVLERGPFNDLQSIAELSLAASRLGSVAGYETLEEEARNAVDIENLAEVAEAQSNAGQASTQKARLRQAGAVIAHLIAMNQYPSNVKSAKTVRARYVKLITGKELKDETMDSYERKYPELVKEVSGALLAFQAGESSRVGENLRPIIAKALTVCSADGAKQDSDGKR